MWVLGTSALAVCGEGAMAPKKSRGGGGRRVEGEAVLPKEELPPSQDSVVEPMLKNPIVRFSTFQCKFCHTRGDEGPPPQFLADM